MKITGKLYLFANKKDINGVIVTDCTTNVSAQDKDGNTKARFYFEVRFSGDNAPTKDQINQLKENFIYEVDVKDGFLGARYYTTQDGAYKAIPQIIIQDCKILSAKQTAKKPTKRKAEKKQEEHDSDASEVSTDLPF